MKWYAPHALEVLGSPGHGYFVWTPLAALAFVGLLLLAIPLGDLSREGGSYRRTGIPPEGGNYQSPGIPPEGGNYTPNQVASAFRRNNVAWLLLLMVFLQVYISGSVDSWTVAGGFGQRRFVALTTVLVLGIAGLLAYARPRKVWIAAIVVCAYWNIAVTAEFATGLMDRQKLEPAKNAYDAVVTLPRMAPGLAYRYLFDRQSFYRAHPVSR
jgi:hypothetical protein